MKIIEHGALPEEKTYQSKCGNCKTVFEFLRKEAKYNSDQREGPFLTINCPLCGNQVIENVK